MKEDKSGNSFKKAPEGKFIVIGNANLFRIPLHLNCCTLLQAVEYADSIVNDEIPFRSSVVNKLGDFTDIDIIDDSGVIQCRVGIGTESILLDFCASIIRSGLKECA